jgi:plasmid maintenance system antidote protein VapI
VAYATSTLFGFSPEERITFEQTAIEVFTSGLLSNAMVDAGITKKKLARKMGVRKRDVRDMLDGCPVPLETLVVAAHALGMRWEMSLVPSER